ESPKACAIFTNTGLRTFDAWTFRNTGNTDTCVRVDFQSNCGTANGIQSEAYLGNFDPNNICTNYLADFGFSLIFSNASYSFIVPAGATFTVVFNENDPGTGCPNYKFTISGLPCFDICVQDDAGRGFIQISSFTGSYSFTRCVKPAYSLTGTGTLTTSGCKILLNDQQSGRNVSSVVNPCTAKGNGTVAFTGKPTTAISDTNIFDNTCTCIP
ncbi:MAG TPA: hypothetical protein VK747_15985, partial [Blastocatellia bacterium]|nr:hypothetical protein [Blastocatellia bacterium]